jgi:hypothetical protein
MALSAGPRRMCNPCARLIRQKKILDDTDHSSGSGCCARAGVVSHLGPAEGDEQLSDNVRRQPPFGRGVFGGTDTKPKSKIP